MIALLKPNPGPLRWSLLAVWLSVGGAVLAEEIRDGTAPTARRTADVRLAGAHHISSTATVAKTASANLIKPPALPALPEGVTELKFTEFYRQPVGPRGLEFTDKLRGLNGRRVRILGYMVRQEQPVPRCFLLTPLPVKLDEHEYGFAEDMPATVLHVFTDASTPAEVPFTPGVLLLTGELSVGNRTEPDGRISSVRLRLDAPSTEQNRASGTTNSVVNETPPSAVAGH